MKDKDGFDIQCAHSDWMIVDNQWNHDFVCTKYATSGFKPSYCYCNDTCKDYRPIKEENNG